MSLGEPAQGSLRAGVKELRHSNAFADPAAVKIPLQLRTARVATVAWPDSSTGFREMLLFLITAALWVPCGDRD